MIIYFSETGITKKAAQRLQSIVGVDVVRIEAAQPYTYADLDWRVENSRANLEQHGKLPAPELAEPVDFGGATEVFLGFPIWWGIPPKVVDSFLSSHDLGNARVHPFCTSGSSPMGAAEEYLRSAFPQIAWTHGLRFHDGLTEEDIRSWADA
ncbi:flavodoxin [Actinotignum sp. GS-2025a]|uniref:flavodoxin n=1 Tax=Actinotignum TaxID=1653174 RepID=UPI000F7D7966|nr:flavodoxin [Actinotignum sanguinis]MDY5147903.1 flavodoxin [Actinotignum sanguinis]RTE48328.1 flavodoxin [Actinotignum sanguinis]